MHKYNRTLYSLITILIVYTVSFVIFVFYSISNFAFTDFYKRLDLRRKLAAEQMLNEDPRNEDFKWTYENVENLDKQHNFIVEFDQTHTILYNNGLDPALWKEISKVGHANFKIGTKFYSTDVYKNDGKMYVVGVSAENYFYTHHIAYLRNLLFISVVLGVLFVIVVSLLVKRSFLRPINGIINEVEKIGSENLFLRLKETEDKSVLNKLAITFNRMLSRIETSFETQKNFVSNASHELNTPLTSIIGTADLALSKERTVAEYQQSLTKIIAAADNLEKKTNALLLLARTGYENNGSNFKPVRIDQIIMDSDLTVKAINERFHIKTDFTLLPEDSMKLKVYGSSVLLQLAFSNIISNACKYSSDHTAYVALGALDNSVIVLIKDEGIGIPEQDLPYIFDPYFRASNTGNFSGYGIGLPLARNIIRMHNGKLNVSSVLGEGTTVRIELPTVTSF